MIYCKSWYAIVCCVWLVVVGFVVMTYVVVGPLGPKSVHRANLLQTNSAFTLIAIAAMVLSPFLLAPFGIKRQRN